MREILFRGKRIDDSKWVYGSMISFDDGKKTILPSKAKVFMQQGTTTICCNECYDVDIATVGQYTGLTDKNGVKIFEGDIVNKTEGTPSVKKVEFHEDEAAFIVTWKFHGHEIYDLLRAYTMPGRNDMEFFEVIGNIYDSPELLKGKKK